MATQRLTVAAVAGDAGTVIEGLFRRWRSEAAPDPAAVDSFCERLRANGTQLPVVYFCEWVDRWLMGDDVPGPGEVVGSRYQATCLSPTQATEWAGSRKDPFPEQRWVAGRLRDAAESWATVGTAAVVVIREVIGPSATDDEIRSALRGIPDWVQV